MDITEQELLTRELERQQAYLAEAQKLTHTASWAWRVSDRFSSARSVLARSLPLFSATISPKCSAHFW